MADPTPEEIKKKAAAEEEAAFFSAQRDDLSEQIDILTQIVQDALGMSRQDVNRHVAELRHRKHKALRHQ